MKIKLPNKHNSIIKVKKQNLTPFPKAWHFKIKPFKEFIITYSLITDHSGLKTLDTYEMHLFKFSPFPSNLNFISKVDCKEKKRYY